MLEEIYQIYIAWLGMEVYYWLQVHDLGSDGQKAISPDQVGIEVKPEHMPAETSAQHSQPAVASHTISEADEAKLAKKAKCCGCTIM